MRPSVAFLTAAGLLISTATCHEGRRAPTEPPPTPSFGSVIVGSQYGADAGAAFHDPVVLLAGPQIYIATVNFEVNQLTFAGCPGSCENERSWVVGTSRTQSGGLRYSAAALTQAGLHMIYDGSSQNGRRDALRYATCPGLCYDSTHWQAIDVDTVGFTGWFDALAADGAGKLHAAYVRLDDGALRYAECDTTCLDTTSWRLATIDARGHVSDVAIGVDAGGHVHVLYRAPNPSGPGFGIRYATCATTCADPASWSSVSLDETPGFAESVKPALAMGTDGRLHVAYWTLADLRYATCAGNCTSLSSWAITTVATTPGGRSNALALGPSGRLHLLYSLFVFTDYTTAGVVRYAACAAKCTNGSAWERMTVDSGLYATDYVALKVDSLDQPHMALSSYGLLEYAWRHQ